MKTYAFVIFFFVCFSTLCSQSNRMIESGIEGTFTTGFLERYKLVDDFRLSSRATAHRFSPANSFSVNLSYLFTRSDKILGMQIGYRRSSLSYTMTGFKNLLGVPGTLTTDYDSDNIPLLFFWRQSQGKTVDFQFGIGTTYTFKSRSVSTFVFDGEESLFTPSAGDLKNFFVISSKFSLLLRLHPHHLLSVNYNQDLSKTRFNTSGLGIWYSRIGLGYSYVIRG